jgi:general secretion pathway protein F
MVQAAEASGALSQILERLAVLLARRQEIRDRIVGALIYPAILLLMIGATLILVLTFVLPRFEILFAEAGAQLPLPTRIVVGLGTLVRDDGLYLALGLAALLIGGSRLLRQPEWRRRIDAALLRNPVVADVLGGAQTAEFARTLGTLVAGGLPLPTALRLAAGTLGNRVLRAAADDLLQSVIEGASLAGRIAAAGCFPALFTQMVNVGEETGRLPASLLQAADMLDRDVQRVVERTLAVAVPLITVVMGALVAGLIGSVLVGILSLNDLAL